VIGVAYKKEDGINERLGVCPPQTPWSRAGWGRSSLEESKGKTKASVFEAPRKWREAWKVRPALALSTVALTSHIDFTGNLPCGSSYTTTRDIRVYITGHRTSHHHNIYTTRKRRNEENDVKFITRFFVGVLSPDCRLCPRRKISSTVSSRLARCRHNRKPPYKALASYDSSRLSLQTVREASPFLCLLNARAGKHLIPLLCHISS
jgi:hypothetical protein